MMYEVLSLQTNKPKAMTNARLLSIVTLLASILISKAQDHNSYKSIMNDTTKQIYNDSYDSLKAMLSGESQMSFKKAVFTSENAFMKQQMQFEKFDSHINQLSQLITAWMQTNPLKEYHFKDSVDLHKNFGIFKLLKDTLRFEDNNQKLYKLLPYTYDFEDFFGHMEWSNMFVTKLLSTQKGNCHSLPYLYKILADELAAKCWLSFAPNHIYIKNRCKKIGRF